MSQLYPPYKGSTAGHTVVLDVPTRSPPAMVQPLQQPTRLPLRNPTLKVATLEDGATTYDRSILHDSMVPDIADGHDAQLAWIFHNLQPPSYVFRLASREGDKSAVCAFLIDTSRILPATCGCVGRLELGLALRQGCMPGAHPSRPSNRFGIISIRFFALRLASRPLLFIPV